MFTTALSPGELPSGELAGAAAVVAGGAVVTCSDGVVTGTAAEEGIAGWLSLVLALDAAPLHPVTAARPAQTAGIKIAPARARRRIRAGIRELLG
jgi:hypothetical protein